jgi:hypothetical protein
MEDRSIRPDRRDLAGRSRGARSLLASSAPVLRLAAAALVAAGVLATGSLRSAAQGIRPLPTVVVYLTGTKFLNLPEHDQETYTMGVFDGLNEMLLHNAPFQRCVGQKLQHMTAFELRTLLYQWVVAHPDRLNEAMSGLALAALFQTCQIPGP